MNWPATLSVICPLTRRSVRYSGGTRRHGEKAIQENSGIPASNNFAYPYGEATLKTKRALGRMMTSCRGTCAGLNGPDLDLNLLRANYLYGGVEKLEAAKQLILRNEIRQRWLIFYTHDVSAHPSAFGCTPELLEAAASFVAERGVRMRTVAQVMGELAQHRTGQTVAEEFHHAIEPRLQPTAGIFNSDAAFMNSQKPVRVLYSFPHKLGAARICYTAWQQVYGLARAGAEVKVFPGAVQRPLPVDVRISPTLARGRFRIPYKVLGTMRALALHDYIVSRRLEKLEGQIDIVHAWPDAALQTLKTASRLGIATVLERPNAHTRYAYEAVQKESQRIGVALPREQ